MHFRLEVRLTPADVGQRVVIRWRPPSLGASGQVSDVLGILEAAAAESFAVRTCVGTVVVIPRTRAFAGKVIPLPPRRQLGGPQSS